MGKIFVEASAEINEEHIEYFEKNKIDKISILLIDNLEIGPYLRNTLAIDKAKSREESLFEIYKILRPGETSNSRKQQKIFSINYFFQMIDMIYQAFGRVKNEFKIKVR